MLCDVGLRRDRGEIGAGVRLGYVLAGLCSGDYSRATVRMGRVN